VVKIPGQSTEISPGTCVEAEAGKTFSAEVHVQDPNQGQRKLIQFASGEGRLNPGNITAGQVTDVTNSGGIGTYSLDIPSTNFKDKYTAEFYARDDAHLSAESGWGSGSCAISVCPEAVSPTPTPTPTPPPPCDETDVTELLFSIDSRIASQKKYVNQSLAMLKRHAPGQTKFMEEVRKRSEEIYLSAWNATWTIPRIILNCPDSITCVTVSHTQFKNEHRADMAEMHGLLRSVVRKLRNATEDRNRGERLIGRSKDRMAETEADLQALPPERDDCQ
jgi:hypothetical protein